MRLIWYSVAMSLDGFIAGPNGEYDWIPEEPTIDWGAFTSRFDTLLMGRRTYEVALAGPEMPGMRSVVVSRTLKAADHPKVIIVSDNVTEAVEELRRAPGKDIWLFGGGELFRNLLQAGLVDRVEVGMAPVLLGRGIPLLPDPGQITKLKLMKSEPYPNGIVMLTYEILR